jgi:Rrf2 family transcriptional regulator, nitric oxide-sensitive transcriptional repressor
MQLTRHSDYSLRVLIYLALHQEKLSNISEIASTFNVSRNHLVKVVHELAKLGYIHTTRGHGGGLELSRSPEDILVGDVIRHTENTFDVINCKQPPCPILPSCKLKRALAEATKAFLETLDTYTIADLTEDKSRLMKLIA